MSSDPITSFKFRDMAEVERARAIALAEKWDGTLSVYMIDTYVESGSILTRTYTPYTWKVEKIRGKATRLMRDTWLTSPYVPRIPPNGKLP